MVKTVLGKVSLTPRGAWAAEAAYEPLDVVGYEGSSYVVLKAVKGMDPVDDGVHYMLMAERGDKGDQGERGVQGERGIQGIKGNKGDAGIQGIQGAQGAQGIRGPEGSQGVQGVQGMQGPKGDRGDRGDRGERGGKGDAGRDGTGVNILGCLGSVVELPSAGISGDAWLIGDNLYVWNPLAGSFVNVGNIRGPQGQKGDQGDRGIDGGVFVPSVSNEGVLSFINAFGLPDPAPVNVRGPQGIQGPQGPQGSQGVQGNQGEQGPQGIPGEVGSVYVPTLSADGTLSFSNDLGLPDPNPVNLMGPAGTNGQDGREGDKGDKGDKGDQGDQGDAGEVMIPSYSAGILSWRRGTGASVPGPMKVTPSVCRSATEPTGVQEGDIWIVL